MILCFFFYFTLRASLTGGSNFDNMLRPETEKLVKKSDGVFKGKTNTLVYAHLSLLSPSYDHGALTKRAPE